MVSSEESACVPVDWAQSGFSWPVFLRPGVGGPGTVGRKTTRKQATHSDMDLCAHSTGWQGQECGSGLGMKTSWIWAWGH